MSLRTTNRRDLARAAWSGGLAVSMTGLVLVGGALLPVASADHVEFEDPLAYDGNKRCEDFGLEPPPEADGWDQFGKVDPTAAIDNEFVTVEITDTNEEDEPTKITVTAKEGFDLTGVLVKGGAGGGGTAYFHEPFEDLQANEAMQAISHYTICGQPSDMTTPPETTPPETTPPETTPPETTPPETPAETTPPVTPAAKTPPPELPVTGAGLGLGIAGGALVLGGLTLALLGRRRIGADS